MRKHLSTIVLLFILLIGLSLLLYPTVSDYWNALHQTKAITTYAENVAALDQASYEAYWEAARAYNKGLLGRNSGYALSEEQQAEYKKLLDISGQGVMGYIEIPEIDVSLPIYHGTEDSVLQVAVGHLEWSSLPVGGKSTHCVLSGHRGLPSAKLFTNLDRLREGNIFLLRVLDEVLTYEVDQILIVEPQDTAALEIVEGQDYCTLVTCTPLWHQQPPAAGPGAPHRQSGRSKNRPGHCRCRPDRAHAGGPHRRHSHIACTAAVAAAAPAQEGIGGLL